MSGNIQFRDERRYANGTIEGSHGYVRPDGTVMVTHFLADSDRGYLSQTQNFAPGDEAKWQENWPTKRPNILMEKPMESVQPSIFYDDNEKLNLTSILLPVEPIKEEHGIDLNPPKLEKELVNPVVLDVINGNAPLVANSNVKDKEGVVGFETVHNFIPSDFPIVPFQLPQQDLKLNLTGGLSDEPMPVHEEIHKYDTQKLNNAEKAIIPAENNEATTGEKYVKSKENNAEKSLPTAAIKSIATNEEPEQVLPKAKAISVDDNISWYDKVIKQTRQGYLENL